MNLGERFLFNSIDNTLPEIRLGNIYKEDPTLQSYMQYYMSGDLSRVEPDLQRMGERSTSIYHQHGVQAELNPPKHVSHNVYGKRVDELVLHQGWKNMKGFSAEEGLISIPYTTNLRNARVYQAAKLYMFGANSGLYNCPLAMTDGAAYLVSQLKKHSPENMTPELDAAFKRLISREPSNFWTSGQWMTEKNGGSDVTKATQTVAIQGDNGRYKLYGYKWFSSATDADMTFALAKIVPNSVKDPTDVDLAAIKPSLFFVRVRRDCGALNNIEIVRLKDKLGTRQLPTAELILRGTDAQLIGRSGQGIKIISHMLNITRLHNSIAAVSGLRKITNVVFDYSHRRQAFGRLIKDHPLHKQMIYGLEMNTRGNLLFVLEVASLLDKTDKNSQTADDTTLLRLLTPVIKLFTAKEAIRWTGEGIEALGALGFLEDSHVPHILRDAYVLSIWEGTTNVLSHDFIRSVNDSSIAVLNSWILTKCRRMRELVSKRLSDILEILKNPPLIEINARNISMNYGLIIVLSLLDANHAFQGGKENAFVMNHWARRLEQEFTLEARPYDIKPDVLKKLVSHNFGKNKDHMNVERPKL